MKLEICTNSIESAINAQKAGASRIELCSELSIGGITPSYGLIKQVLFRLNIPVFVLVRPRGGNFVYSNEEFEIMKSDILACKELGCAGIVSGVLFEDNSIDIERTKELVELSRPLSFTYHRAFDLTPDPFIALNQLEKLKVNRILTSGQQLKAVNGIRLLLELQKKGATNLIIIPGGGINSGNAYNFKEAGFKEIHCSASRKINQKPNLPLENEFFGDYEITVSNEDEIQSIVNLKN